MKKEITTLKIKNNLILNNGFHLYILFGFILLICTFYDLYNTNSNLIITFLFTTLTSFIFTLIGIPKLKKIKIQQIIRKEGPKKHFLKEGTPTMGGIFFIPVALIVGNILYFQNENYLIILTLTLLIIFFMIIGFLDDLISLKKKLNTGLTPNRKLFLQIIISLLFIFICGLNQYITQDIIIANKLINIGYLIYPLGIFVLLAESNSTNLTDGLDGLLSGCSVLVFTGLGIDILIENQNNSSFLSQLCIVFAGTCMGFLFLNKNPAKIFMGDSGSLAIGAALGGIALISNNLWSLLIMSGVFVLESLSVIIQVSIFKISKRINGKGYKLFLMSPIHHHFELKNNNENAIVGSFWLITLFLVVLNLIFFTKP